MTLAFVMLLDQSIISCVHRKHNVRAAKDDG